MKKIITWEEADKFIDNFFKQAENKISGFLSKIEKDNRHSNSNWKRKYISTFYFHLQYFKRETGDMRIRFSHYEKISKKDEE